MILKKIIATPSTEKKTVSFSVDPIIEKRHAYKESIRKYNMIIELFRVATKAYNNSTSTFRQVQLSSSLYHIRKQIFLSFEVDSFEHKELMAKLNDYEAINK